jgi:hypothetical protein
MTPRKTPAQPVANLAQSRKEMTAAKAAHPAGKKATPAAKPAAKAPATKVAKKPAGEAKVYSATGRGGVVRRSTSTSVLSHAVDCKISGRRGSHFSQGVVVAFFATEAAARKAADKINAVKNGDWSDAIIVAAKAVS